MTKSHSMKQLCCEGQPLLMATMLFLCCYTQASLYYAVDLVAGIEATTIKVVGIDATQYNVLFSSYVWPDIVTSLVGSVMVDKYLGVRIGFVVLLAISVLTQCVVVLGTYLGVFWIMLIGRAAFGCTVGTLVALVNCALVLLFDTKAVFAFFFKGCLIRFAAVLALLTTQRLYDSLHFLPTSLIKLGSTMSVGLITVIIGFLSGVAILVLDQRIGNKLKKVKQEQSSFLSLVRAIRKFPVSFWLLNLVSGFYYSVIFSLISNGQLFFISKYGLSTNDASLVNSITYAGTIIISPFLGLLITATKHRSLWMILGTLMGLVSHVIFVLGSDNIVTVYLAAVFISFSYSIMIGLVLVSAALMVAREHTTIAFGVCMSVYNLFYCVLSVISGVLIDYYGFFLYEIFNVEILFTTLLLLGLVLVEEFLDKRARWHTSGSLKMEEKNKSSHDQSSNVAESSL